MEAYCREQGVPFHFDGSNEDIAYSRNRIRHRVTGELKALNPRVEEAARRLSETVRQEDAYLDGLAQAAYQTAWLDDEGKQLNRCKLREMPPRAPASGVGKSRRRSGGRTAFGDAGPAAGGGRALWFCPAACG